MKKPDPNGRPKIILWKNQKLKLLRGAIRRIKRSENRSMMAALSMESDYNLELPFIPIDALPRVFPLLKFFFVEVHDSCYNMASVRYTDELPKKERIRVLMQIGMAIKHNKHQENLNEVTYLMTD